MIWAELGTAALLAALALSGFAAVVSFVAGQRDDLLVARVGRRGLYACAAMVALASACLLAALLGHAFVVAYVTAHTNRSLAAPLLAAAFYSGQEGSLLYWTLVLAVVGSVALAAASGPGARLQAYAGGILATITAFFLVVLVFVSSPFDVLAFTPADGLGLNPVLKDGGMLIHPPFLLAGFASFTIPFSFALAALLAGRHDPAWIAQTRRLALLAWALQGTGLLLGMWWAYHVLGWGGYWGWDPVENMALLPWLATTAYLHSAQVEERRGQLRAWTQGLVLLAFLLAVLGTFITRSGVLPSVHSFAVSGVGPWFFGLLAASVVVAGGLMAVRSERLRSRPLELGVSREAAFLLQNLLFVGLIAAVLWGTLLPLLTGLVAPQRVVGPAYYERVATPLFLGLLALLAAGPLVPWRRTGSTWRRGLAWPLAALAAAGGLLWTAGVRQPVALLALALAAAAAATALREFALAVEVARRLAGAWPLAAARLAARNRRRYAAHLIHVGVLVAAAGIAGSHLWQAERTVSLQPGETATVAGYRLEYAGSQEVAAGDHSRLVARLRLGGETLEPARLTYPALGGQAVSQVAIRSTPWEDLYVVLNGQDDGGAASFRILVNPLVTWIWAGGGLFVLGVLLGHLPAGPARASQPASSAAVVPG